MSDTEKIVVTSPEMEVGSAADVDAIMKKYDRESNVRVWDGIPKAVVRYMLVAFAIYSILLRTRRVRLPRIRKNRDVRILDQRTGST